MHDEVYIRSLLPSSPYRALLSSWLASCVLHEGNRPGTRIRAATSGPAARFEVDERATAGKVACAARRRRQKQVVPGASPLACSNGRMQPKADALLQHSLRVESLARRLAHHLALTPAEIDLVGQAARWHDLGKLAIPQTILGKAALLTPQEFAVVRQHSAFGASLLLQMHFPRAVATLVYHHHERWDGCGYPEGLRGDTIPLGARIIAIADAFDAMTSHRPYRSACTPTQAVEELLRCAGSQFDPFLVEHCSSLLAIGRSSLAV